MLQAQQQRSCPVFLPGVCLCLCVWDGEGWPQLLNTVLQFQPLWDRGHARRGFSSVVHKRRLPLVKSPKFTCYHTRCSILEFSPPLLWAWCHFSDGSCVSHGICQIKCCFGMYTPPLETTQHGPVCKDTSLSLKPFFFL